ncbi:MAG: class I SAM-dependent methyltransferase [Anaerolineales bacterium]
MEDIRRALQQAYTANVKERDTSLPQPWKLAERAAFLQALQVKGAGSLLELGAGTGQDAAFFAAHGLEVLATDLTAENVAACRQKGLHAEVMDVCDLRLPAAGFDAAYSLNCLLHLAKAEFPLAIENIHRVLKLGGLLYLGLYGGMDSEGVYQEDSYEPKRFFSFWTDEGLRNAVAPLFDIFSFTAVELEEGSELHFQSLILGTRQSPLSTPKSGASVGH